MFGHALGHGGNSNMLIQRRSFEGQFGTGKGIGQDLCSLQEGKTEAEGFPAGKLNGKRGQKVGWGNSGMRQ